jgi:chromosome segregation ATPase
MEGSATKIAALEARVMEIEEIVRQKETAAKALEQNLSVKIQDLETQLRNKNKLLVDRDKQVKDLTSQLKTLTSRMKKMSSFLRQAEALASIEAREPGTVASGQLQREKEHPATAQLSGPHLTSTASDQATVSSDLFDRIIQELSRIMGPMAPMIVRHDVAALGESIEKFPRKRLAELLDIVTKEVMDENLKCTLRERFVEIL